MAMLDGVRAVITGAAGGIGKATAARFLAEGAQVVLADLNHEQLEAIANSFAEADRVVPVAGDVSNPADVTTLVEVAKERLGGIDVLVNNAGIECVTPLADSSLDQIDRTLAINLRGVLLVTRAVVPVMQSGNGGAIVSVASQAAKRGTPEVSIYSATKAGVLGMTRSLAVELAPQIRVNAVCPGIVKTDMMSRHYRKMMAIEGISLEEAEKQFDSVIPLGRQQLPGDIASSIAFLASNQASEITGQALNVCGGMTMD